MAIAGKPDLQPQAANDDTKAVPALQYHARVETGLAPSPSDAIQHLFVGAAILDSL